MVSTTAKLRYREQLKHQIRWCYSTAYGRNPPENYRALLDSARQDIERLEGVERELIYDEWPL